ncbi:hypothetical protein GY45DRAFT_744648 [Cubamyces sp. BRFM 1775]|nr:hypothetical protein GY45DRAFT_744648 [Cubamyces sp. BRFM 1775]
MMRGSIAVGISDQREDGKTKEWVAVDGDHLLPATQAHAELLHLPLDRPGLCSKADRSQRQHPRPCFLGLCPPPPQLPAPGTPSPPWPSFPTPAYPSNLLLPQTSRPPPPLPDTPFPFSPFSLPVRLRQPLRSTFSRPRQLPLCVRAPPLPRTRPLARRLTV